MPFSREILDMPKYVPLYAEATLDGSSFQEPPRNTLWCLLPSPSIQALPSAGAPS